MIAEPPVNSIIQPRIRTPARQYSSPVFLDSTEREGKAGRGGQGEENEIEKQSAEKKADE